MVLKNVLMIVPAFPPDNTSATARPMHFARNLPEFGYWPLVLVQSGIWTYPQDPELVEFVRDRCDVFAVAASSAWPVRLLDKTWRWCLGAVQAGLRLHRARTVDVIWSTSPSILQWYPAAVLSRITGLPLVVDVRDPVTYGSLWHPKNPLQARARRLSERAVMAQASRIVQASPLTMRVMGARAGPRLAGRMVPILNGFASEQVDPMRDQPRTRCTFLYAGKFERHVREPRLLLQGLKHACSDPQFAQDVCLELIGGLGEFASEVTELGLSDHVRDLGYRSMRESLARIAGADILVLFQPIAGSGNDVISGKAYEYLAARRPILGVVSEDGGDAWLMRETNAGRITGLDSVDTIAAGLWHYWQLWRQGALESAVHRTNIDRFDRRFQTSQLAELFDQVIAEHRGRP